MTYGDKGKEREATRERVRRYRAKGVTFEGVTRINPHTGKGYGPMMAGFGDETLSEYEHKWGQETPCYVPHERRGYKPVLVIAELSPGQRDWLYKCSQRVRE